MDQTTKDQGNAQLNETGMLLSETSNALSAALQAHDWKRVEEVISENGQLDRAGKSNDAMADLWESQPVDGESGGGEGGGGDGPDVDDGGADGTGTVDPSELTPADQQYIYVWSVTREEGVYRRVLDASASEISQLRNNAAYNEIPGIAIPPQKNINEYQSADDVPNVRPEFKAEVDK